MGSYVDFGYAQRTGVDVDVDVVDVVARRLRFSLASKLEPALGHIAIYTTRVNSKYSLQICLRPPSAWKSSMLSQTYQ
jgi:hypothetical protein